jgi:phage tail-like protein
VLLADDGTDLVRWTFVDGWVAKYESSDLNAKANEVAIETIEIAHEGLSRED